MNAASYVAKFKWLIEETKELLEVEKETPRTGPHNHRLRYKRMVLKLYLEPYGINLDNALQKLKELVQDLGEEGFSILGSLEKFAFQYNISYEDYKQLISTPARGKRPSTVEEWKVIWEQMKMPEQLELW